MDLPKSGTGLISSRRLGGVRASGDASSGGESILRCSGIVRGPGLGGGVTGSGTRIIAATG